MEITSVNNQLIKDMAKLHQKKHRDETSLFLIEGYHLYEEALKMDVIKTIFTTDDIIQGHNVIHVSQSVLEKLAKTNNPQKVICVCEKLKREKINDRVLILEGIQDPGNLGTLLRSALAFDFKTIILDNTVDIYNDKVIRSTQGAMFKLNFIEMGTLDFMNLYRDYTYIGTSLKGEPLESIRALDRVVLILGNEGNGLSLDVLKNTNKNVTIKISEVESLNVGVAGSIIMHHINSNT
ncbi:MAG: 23S rRNA (adenosine(1067)-2'-O)-methyltransferase [Candidatus Izimaplasma bacterium HR2]|nr:MAG: 23S rRNA (adenosine(1067)-2'-O)-methyltransferase [Candidatus Izimaplasma bacterium HR2]